MDSKRSAPRAEQSPALSRPRSRPPPGFAGHPPGCSLHFPDQIRPDVRGFGVDASAELREQRHETRAEAVPHSIRGISCAESPPSDPAPWGHEKIAKSDETPKTVMATTTMRRSHPRGALRRAPHARNDEQHPRRERSRGRRPTCRRNRTRRTVAPRRNAAVVNAARRTLGDAGFSLFLGKRAGGIGDVDDDARAPASLAMREYWVAKKPSAPSMAR